MNITRDPDSGVVDQDAPDLDLQKVVTELKFCITHNLSFMGHSPNYWLERLTDHAQELADKADSFECELWNISAMEAT